MPDPTFTVAPAVPSRAAPATFSERTDTFIAWEKTFRNELSSSVAWFGDQVSGAGGAASAASGSASDAAGSASAAADSAAEAAASASLSASAGAAAAGADVWVSGGSYTANVSAVVSPTNQQTYRAKTTHTGVTTDPSADSTNWQIITMPYWQTKSAAYTASVSDRILADTSGGAFTVTLPATPTPGAEVWFADPGLNWAANNLTVSGGGKNIAGDGTFAADIGGGYFTAIYDGTEWQVRLTGGSA